MRPLRNIVVNGSEHQEDVYRKMSSQQGICYNLKMRGAKLATFLHMLIYLSMSHACFGLPIGELNVDIHYLPEGIDNPVSLARGYHFDFGTRARDSQGQLCAWGRFLSLAWSMGLS